MLEREVFVECQSAGCASILQVVVPPTHRQGKGEVLVRCGKCHRLLRVQLPPELLQSALPPVPADPTTQLAQLHRPTGSRPAQQRLQHPLEYHHDDPQNNHQQQPLLPQHQQGHQPDAIPHTPDQTINTQGMVPRRRRAPSAYQEFIGQEMKRLKATHPDLDHASAFKMAASSWVASEAKAAADQAKGEQQPPLQPAELQHGAAQQPPLAAEQQYGHSGSSAQAQQQSGAIDCSDSTGPEEPYLAVGAGASLPTAPAQEHLPEPGPNATGSQAVEADVRQQAGGVDAGHVMERQQQPTTQPAAVAPAAVASVQQPGATPVLTAMPPPAARVASTNSDAVNSHQSAATGPSLDPQPAADSTAGAGSGSEVHVTSAPLTLEQTWQTLCNQHAPTADAHGAHRPNAAPALLQQQQPSACTAAPFAAGSTFGRQQVTTELGPSHTGLKESSPGAAAAAAAAVTSEGSDLASWSSGMTPGQAGHTAADPVLASPGALSGSAANSMPNILRHNSAPITTAVAFVPRQSKPVAYSITTTGPSKPAKR